MRFDLRTRKQRILAGGAATGVLALVATGAIAFYAQQTAEANTSASQYGGIRIESISAAGGLIPGGEAKTITVNLWNPTQETLPVTTVNVVVKPGWYATKTPDSKTPKPCTAADFKIDPVYVNGSLNPDQRYPVAAKISMINADYDQENCKGVDIPLVATVQ